MKDKTKYGVIVAFALALLFAAPVLILFLCVISVFGVAAGLADLE